MLAKQITDRERFLKIVAEAVAAAHRNCEDEQTRNRWVRAVAKAAAAIEEQGEFMNFDQSEGYLVIWSQRSGVIYSANGVCQCEAYREGFRHNNKPYPCYHRAAARLFRLFLGGAENPTPRFPNGGGAAVVVAFPSPTSETSAETAAAAAPTATAKEMDEALYVAGGYKAAAAKKVGGFRL